jgi:hypothetical protein
MVKIESWIFTLLLVFCILLTGYVANSQQEFSKTGYTERLSSTQTKFKLARTVLSEAGIDKKYNLYLGNGIDLALNPETSKKPKFVKWMEGVLVREAGWKFIEDKYLTQMEVSFSEKELRELINIAEKPIMKKLLQTEILSYADATVERRRLLSQLWDKYNGGFFIAPPEVLQ